MIALSRQHTEADFSEKGREDGREERRKGEIELKKERERQEINQPAGNSETRVSKKKKKKKLKNV